MKANRRASATPRRVLCILALAFASIAPALGITVVFTGPDTQVILGELYGSLEFDNPLSGGETVAGRLVLEWRDAGWSCLGSGPADHEDWTVSVACSGCSCPIDGYQNEIWLRVNGHSTTTTTTVPSTEVSIHLHGDNNDGVADISVDGTLIATLNMFTSGVDNALIVASGLPNTTHTIVVADVDPGNGDIAVMGAAALGVGSNVLRQSTINSAGETASSAGYVMTASLGQELTVGTSSAPGYVLQSGFWSFLGSGLVPVILTVERNSTVPSNVDLTWSGNNSPYDVYQTTDCTDVFNVFLVSATGNSISNVAPPAADLVCYSVLATAPGKSSSSPSPLYEREERKP